MRRGVAVLLAVAGSLPAWAANAFNQVLADEAAVKEYCNLTFELTLPMTETTHVKGDEAHPFYAWLNAETGFVPGRISAMLG